MSNDRKGLIEIGHRKGTSEKFREKEGRKGLASACSNQYVFYNQYSIMDNRYLTKFQGHLFIGT